MDVIFGAGGLTGSAGIKYASAPQGTAVVIAGRTTFNGTKTEAAAPYVVGVDSDEYFTTFESGAWPGAPKLISSALKRVDVSVQLAIENYFTGVAAGSNFRLDCSNDGVGFAPAHDASDVVTAAISAVAETVYASMAAGTFSTYITADGEIAPDETHWIYDLYGTIITHPCGTGSCLAESEYLIEEMQLAACAGGAYQHKVTAVLGSIVQDGTFMQLAYTGAVAACTSEASCCLEIDILDDDVEEEETTWFCEIEYAAQDSDLVIGVGFTHEQSVHRAAMCVRDTNFAIVDVACTPGCGSNPGRPRQASAPCLLRPTRHSGAPRRDRRGRERDAVQPGGPDLRRRPGGLPDGPHRGRRVERAEQEGGRDRRPAHPAGEALRQRLQGRC